MSVVFEVHRLLLPIFVPCFGDDRPKDMTVIRQTGSPDCEAYLLPPGGPLPRVLVWYEGAGEAAYRICERIALWLGRDLPAGNIGLATTAGPEFDARAHARGNRVFTYTGPAGRRAKGAVLTHFPANWRRFGRLLDQFRPDVVILAMNFAPAWPLVLQLRRRGIRLVYIPHDPQPHSGDFARGWQVFSQNRVLAAADLIVPMSTAMLTAARMLGGDFSRLPARVVPLHTLGVPRRSAGRSPVTGGPLKMLFFGRLIAYKGFDLLAEACRLLAHRDDWSLTIAGDGPMKADVPVLFSGLENKVRLDQLRHLAEDEVDALVASHDLLVCPYRDATQSAVIAEAILEAVPSIVTPAGALPEQVDFGRAGYVASAMTGAALAEAIAAALDDRAGLARRSADTLAFWQRTAAANPWLAVVRQALAPPGVAPQPVQAEGSADVDPA